MFTVDETEIAWLARNKATARFVAFAAAVLFASYGLLDWLMAPQLLGAILPWRMVGALTCLATYFLLRSDSWFERTPFLLALTGVVVTAVVSIIFLVLLKAPTLALAAQLQVLIFASLVSTIRSTMRTTLAGMWVFFNLGLWWLDMPAQTVLQHNAYLLGGVILVLVISEIAYRTFKSRLALEITVQQQANIVQSSDDAIIARAPDGTVTSWNPGAQKLFGYTPDEMVGRSLQLLLAPDRSAEEQSHVRSVLDTANGRRFETERFGKGGERKELSVVLSPIRDATGSVVGVSEIARDITDKNRASRALLDQDARFRVAIETTPDGFLAVGKNGQIIDSNIAYSRLSGYGREELLQMRVSDLEANEDPAATARHMEEIMAMGSATFESRHRRRDGADWPVEIITTFSPVFGGQFYTFIRDLTERKRVEAMTWHQANFDYLTNLPNRALLFDRLNQDCALARRNESAVALLFADLDGFKRVNDQRGHQAGDLVLQEVARRWLATVRESDTVARLGGDEFAIVMNGVQDTQVIGTLAEKLIAALSEPIDLADGTTCVVGASIGIAVYPSDTGSPDGLISHADTAMYESKRKGKNCFTFAASKLKP